MVYFSGPGYKNIQTGKLDRETPSVDGYINCHMYLSMAKLVLNHASALKGPGPVKVLPESCVDQT